MTARTTHLDAGVRDAMIALGAAAKKGLGVITVINSWNRLMVSCRIVPGGPQW
ncbi:hypothetical protein ABZS88_25150 [Streptomyces sp. NPDC005480]|uniref:hypothetical protein n=1 Tax=Streptomyces sp. NPDC005480 TaxID=3154880 RepID=UPI0033A0ADDF